MLYGASVYLRPTIKGDQRTSKSIRLMTRIQRQAAILITGAMRTTAADILDAHANLLPLTLTVNRFIHREATRIAALPESHPLHQEIRLATRCLVKSHPSPLHVICHRLQLDPNIMESIPSFRQKPSWTPSHQSVIPPDSRQALYAAQQFNTYVQVFTDGSLINRQVQ